MTPTNFLISISLEPKTRSDQERMGMALATLTQEDPTLGAYIDPESGQVLLRAADELQLQSIVDRLLREYKVEMNFGRPHVIYRETIRKQAEAEGKYIRQIGGSGNYAHVKIRLEPNEPGKGFEFINDIKGGVVPKEFIKPTEQGIREALQGGVLAAYEIVDVKATLFDGSYHDFDSNEMAFKIAGSMAFKEAARKAVPVLLEPVMSVEVVVPEEYMGTIIGDLNSRRGRIEGMESRAGSQVLKANVPMSEMFGYARNLQFLTHARATHSMHFKAYEQRPNSDFDDDTQSTPAIKPKGPRPRNLPPRGIADVADTG
jgi:elongation factor G